MEVAKRRTVVELETSRRVPDVTFAGGVSRFEETDNYAFLLGISIPLMINDRNQGNIAEAHARLAKAQEERRAAGILLRTELAGAFEDLVRYHAKAATLRETILPAAERTLLAVRRGYEEGKFGILDVLDAQTTLFDAKKDYVNAITGYHLLKADTEGIIGKNLEEL
jgi:cobalt-zinc-cadmium efflux system outer membrane protein